MENCKKEKKSKKNISNVEGVPLVQVDNKGEDKDDNTKQKQETVRLSN